MVKGRDAKPHIGIFGKRNNGKSSLINALIGQDIAIVSEVAGTTADPVKKSVEIEGVGPAIIIDTAGIDDVGDLGKLRTAKSKATIDLVDLAMLVITENDFGKNEEQLIASFNKNELPYLIVHNKSDIEAPSEHLKNKIQLTFGHSLINYSALQAEKYNPELLEKIRESLPDSAYKKRGLIGNLVNPGDIVLLITPIDTEAPEGRMILPQQQVIRDVLDNDCTAIVLKEGEVDAFLQRTGVKPDLAITDSQAFQNADASIPKDIPLTSFSIVLARQKGDFQAYLEGTPKIGELKDGDRVLILESCSHHVSCDDIGRVKIPRWISNFTGKKIEYDTVAGLDTIPHSVDDYSLVVQCGGCMITHRQIINRLKDAKKKSIPVTNYGMAIAYVHGIFQRAVEPFIGKMDDGNLI